MPLGSPVVELFAADAAWFIGGGRSGVSRFGTAKVGKVFGFATIF
jgi:hypothetical protein